MRVDLENKIAIISGGAKGIGKAIASNLAANGAAVYLLDTDAYALDQTAIAIRKAGGEVSTLLCDVGDHKQVKQSIANLNLPQVDILINNAGVSHIGDISATTEADFDRIYRINVKGVFNLSQAVYPLMKVSGGLILNMASVAAQLGIEQRFAYSMSKGAVLTMTYAMAKDGLQHNIRCNSISPARVHTPFVDGYLSEHYPGREKEMYKKLSATQPIGRMGTPQEIAHLVLYLCAPEASFITGTDFPIDGGFIKLNS